MIQQRLSSLDYATDTIVTVSKTRTRAVKLLKIFLPVIAIVLIGIVAVRFNERGEERPDISLTSAEITKGEIAVTGARYEGHDTQNRPYEVTAARAVKSLTGSDDVSLTDPTARLDLGDEVVTLKSKSGLYNIKSTDLSLASDVEVGFDGYTLYLSEAKINASEGWAKSSSPIKAEGTDVVITGEGLEIINRGEHVVVQGPAKAVLRGKE